jgi:carbohydrate kinase (thermoresistant glucokinase family)
LREAISHALNRGEPLVVACSALKGRYRTELQVSPDVRFIFLTGSPDLLRARINARKGHFAAPALIESQLATLEVPSDALTLDVVHPPEVLVAQALQQLSLAPA